jgi:hypothetical protein
MKKKKKWDAALELDKGAHSRWEFKRSWYIQYYLDI